MPYGDEKHKLIYKELVNILGVDNVADDPAITEAVRRDRTMPKNPVKPEFIVLPGSTEDVQQIVRLANRYKFPFSVSSTGLHFRTCAAMKPYWLFIDPKRMNSCEIDKKNMYAIVQPYFTIAQLQAEAMKVGLFYPVAGSSCQASVLANSTFHAGHWTSYRTGIGTHVLGVEWVLPTGEVLRTGSLATGGGFCWGEGPGPDSRSLLRAHFGHLGALGVTTKLAVKLFTWPGPRVWPTEGVQPEKKSVLPADTFKTYFITYPTYEKSVAAIQEMGKAEIGSLVMKFTPWDIVCWAAKSHEEFWQRWENPFWSNQIKNEGHIVWVGLWGTASPKQLEYEDKVLKDIIKDTGGKLFPEEEYRWAEECLGPNGVRDTHRLRFLGIGGRVAVTGMVMDTPGDSIRSIKEALEVRDKFTPPFGDTGRSIKFWMSNFARIAFTEFDVIDEKSDESIKTGEAVSKERIRIAVEQKSPCTSLFVSTQKVGAAFSDVHVLLGKIKKGLDPNNVANPGRTIDMDEMKKMGYDL